MGVTVEVLGMGDGGGGGGCLSVSGLHAGFNREFKSKLITTTGFYFRGAVK